MPRRPRPADHAQHCALSFPEVTESPHFDSASFRARGKIFATLPAGDEQLHVFVGEDETKAFVAEDGGAFEELWWGKKLWGVRVRPVVRAEGRHRGADRQRLAPQSSEASRRRVRRVGGLSAS